jgi:hypothetical protein
MSNIFTLNPIKINLISIKNVINKSIIFIGTVPIDVKKELQKIEAGGVINKNNKSLINFYGKNWIVKLGINKRLNAVGGVDLPDSDDFGFNDDINGNEITLDELDESNDSFSNIDDSNIKTEQITKSKGIIKFIFDDPYISLYPEDTIMDFKMKIYCILKIPIFMQHIWYVFQSRTYSVNYSIFDDGETKYINAQNMLDVLNSDAGDNQLIEGIPINMAYYQRKSTLKITTDDTFSILDEFYHKYGITEYNLLDLDDFIKPVRINLNNLNSDKYQIELIYYGFIILYWPMLSLDAFSEYVKSPNSIQKFYPDLQPNINEIIQKYTMEKTIIDEKNDLITNIEKKKILKTIYNTITNSITNSIITIASFDTTGPAIVLIRNLFDNIPLNDTIISCKCSIFHNNRTIILNKKYKDNNFIKHNINLQSIMFKIKINTTSNRNIKLIIDKYGNMKILSKWREEEQYGFEDILLKCQNLTYPIIDKINSIGSCVLLLNKKLPRFDVHNAIFTEIGIGIFYKKIFDTSQFNDIREILKDYVQAGLIIHKSSELSILEYYFSKGMYQYNKNQINRIVNIVNHYDFLTDGVIKQKWKTLYENSRSTKIFHRMSDIKIEICGVKEHEFFIFYNLIVTLFYLFITKSTNNKKLDSTKATNPETQLKLSLKNLKEQDPVLYNFKNKYKSKNVYSKICQKPYQPLLLNKHAYDILPPDKKKNALKYWNFTSNKDVYYSCPNSKFPFIKFIVDKHPEGYCIPCCKKTKISQNNTDAKKIIHDICIKSHKYEKTNKTITLGSKYIMTYGKDVEPGRLSRLPEESLEPLFYETFSVNISGIDSECVLDEEYYLYGVEQNMGDILNIGIIIILINATDTHIYDFIKNIINLLKISPTKFKIILGGKINKYFTKLDDFINILSDTFINQKKLNLSSHDKKIPWNEIFISIAFLFLNINIIYFEHIKNDFNLILPSYITNKDQLTTDTFTNLLILKKVNKYYPIYLLNTEVFFKVNMVKQKLFNSIDPIMNILGKLVFNYFNNSENVNNVDISLDIINLFVHDTDYNIKKLYVNKQNLCYYIHITKSGNKTLNIFIPIELSTFLNNKNTIITYELFLRNAANVDIKVILNFINEFNQWVAKKSEMNGLLTNSDIKIPLMDRVHPIHPYIMIKNWIVLCDIDKDVNDKSIVIGFISANINYYIKNITADQAIKIKNIPMIQVLYDPDIINNAIYKNKPTLSDNRSKKIGKSLYETYLYKLIVLEFISIFNGDKNTKMRMNIKKLLLKNLNSNYDDIIESIKKCLSHPKDFDKIKIQIYEFINVHRSKDKLLKSIDLTNYNFDRESYECIKKLPPNQIYNELLKISKKFVTIGSIDNIKDFNFPNMFIACNNDKKNSQQYCKKNKIIISDNNLKAILKILSSDILNPFKEKWLFSPIFTDNIINIFKFIKRNNEFITIEVLE